MPQPAATAPSLIPARARRRVRTRTPAGPPSAACPLEAQALALLTGPIGRGDAVSPSWPSAAYALHLDADVSEDESPRVSAESSPPAASAASLPRKDCLTLSVPHPRPPNGRTASRIRWPAIAAPHCPETHKCCRRIVTSAIMPRQSIEFSDYFPPDESMFVAGMHGSSMPLGTPLTQASDCALVIHSGCFGTSRGNFQTACAGTCSTDGWVSLRYPRQRHRADRTTRRRRCSNCLIANSRNHALPPPIRRRWLRSSTLRRNNHVRRSR